jgi:hypothetical protein
MRDVIMKNMLIKKIVVLGLFLLLIAGFMPVFARVEAASLKFTPATVSTAVDKTFELQINVDAGTKEVLGVDALLQYDNTKLKVEGITDGTYLSVGQKDTNKSGKVYVAGVVDSPGESVTGSGVLATVKFKVIAGGESEVKYICEIGETNESNISENSTDAPDLIDCSTNGKAIITAGGGTSSGGTTPGSSSTTPPSTLPKTGVFDDLVTFAVIGGVLLVVGSAAKLLL